MSSSPDQPPRVRTGRGRRLWMIASGVLLAGVLLVIVLNIDAGPVGTEQPEQAPEIFDVVPPPLARENLPEGPIAPGASSGMPELQQGGWIQSVDPETGRLAQQYRFESLDPNPAGMPADWVQMEKPRAEIYQPGDRVIALSGDSAFVHLPHRVLESGTLMGDVRIAVYELPAGRLLDRRRDEPVLVMHTTAASFDNVIGEIRSHDPFRIEAKSAEFAGRGLSVLIDDRAQPLRPRIEVESVEFVRLVGGASPRGAAAGGGGAADAASPRAARDAAPPPADTPAAAAEPVQYYRLSLRDDVSIRQGGRTGHGEALSIVFSSESRGLPALAAAPALAPTRLTAAGAVVLASFAAAADGAESVTPPPGPDDVYITCSGGLTLVPLDEPSAADDLPAPTDARLLFSGSPVLLEDATEEARATCARLVHHLAEERTELLGSEAHPLSIDSAQLAARGEAFWLRGARGGFTGPGRLTATGQGGGEPLEASWSEGLDLAFGDAPGDAEMGPLRRATFRGRVEASAGDRGSLACRELLDVEFGTDDRGETVPAALSASGDVRAADAEQTMWADRVRAAFMPRAPGTETAMAVGDDLAIEQLDADGDVQVLLAGGARAFADRLVARDDETVELTGADVALAQKEWLVEGGRRLLLSRGGTGEWPGPGTATMFDRTIPTSLDGRIKQDRLDYGVAVRATWRDALRFDEAAGGGEGAVVLTGDVEVLAEPEATERTTFRAEIVTIGLVEAAGGPDEARGIGRVVAVGDAKLENRTWRRADRSDAPQLFYVSGARLEYDQRSGEALVPGAGELLIRDPPRDPGGAQVLAGRGTTAFRWAGKLEMTRREGTVYDVVMLDRIEMRHLDPQGGKSTLAGDRIEAAIDRPEAAGAASLSGGSAELRRLRAEDNVFLRTPRRDVDCDAFEYDAESGLAALSARDGRYVTIYTHGMPQPIRVQRAEWDLTTDTVRISRGAAGASR